jgi:hypothetical protein
VATAFFTSVTRAALDDAIAAFGTPGSDPGTVLTLLSQVSNNLAALEDMQRDRMLYLDLTSDPGSSATERDYANNVLRNEFSPGVQNKGGSARSNKIFAAYQVQFLKATQFASAKATANRHLASSTGTANYGAGVGSAGNNGSTAPNPASKAQLRKKAEKQKAAAERAAAAAAGAKPDAVVGKPKKERKGKDEEGE